MDGGDHWTQVSPLPVWQPPYASVEQFVVSPRYGQDQTLWLRGHNEGSLVSRDGGANWQPLPDPVAPLAAAERCFWGNQCVVQLFGSVYIPDIRSDRVYTSLDYGRTWQCLETPVTPPQPPYRRFLPIIRQASP